MYVILEKILQNMGMKYTGFNNVITVIEEFKPPTSYCKDDSKISPEFNKADKIR